MSDPIERVVAQLRRSMTSSSTSPSRGQLGVLLVALAKDYAGRGQLREALAEADEAARLLDENLGSAEPEGFNNHERLWYVSAARKLRFEIAGDLDALDLAITAAREGLDEVPDPDPNRSTYLSNLGNLLRLRFERMCIYRDLEEAVAFQRAAVNAVSDDDRDRTSLLVNLGTTLRIRYEATGEVDTLDEAVAVLRQAAIAMPRSSPNWLRRQSNLGSALRARYSRLADNRDLLEAERILQEASESAPEDSADAHDVLANLAVVLMDLYRALNDPGKLLDASRAFEKVFAWRDRVLGGSHPDTLATRNNLANSYAQQGRFGEAERMYRDALAVLDKTLGEVHPDSLATRNNLANVHVQQGRLREAESLYRETLGTLEQRLGLDHPDTLAALNNLAYTYVRQGRLDEARDTYSSVFVRQRHKFGSDHPATLRAKTLWTALSDMLARKQESAPVTRIVVVVDIARFSKATDSQQLALRDNVYYVMRSALSDINVPWDECAVDDQGDGLLLLLPFGTPRHLVVDRAPDALLSAIREVNHLRPASEWLRLRLVVHAGEVHIDSHGVAGDVVVEAHRMADSAQLGRVLKDASTSLAVMISNPIYKSVGSFYSGARYLPASINVKNVLLTAWIRRRRPLELLASSSEGAVPQPGIDRDFLNQLTDALLTVPLCQRDSGRRLLLERLGPEIAGGVSRHARARQDVEEIVLACYRHGSGLQDLINAVFALDSHWLPLHSLSTTIGKLLPRLQGPERSPAGEEPQPAD